jgi:hypothetical protein
MKRIEGFMSFEAVGVPKGLVEISGKVYEVLVKKIKDGRYTVDSEPADPDVYKYPTRHIYMETDVRAKELGDVRAINDYDIRQFNVMVNLDVVDYPKEFTEDSPAERMAGAGYGPKAKLDRKNFKTVYEDNGDIDIRISLRFFEPREKVEEDDYQYWERMVVETFEHNRSGIVSNLGHEIMHAYDLGHVKGEEGHYASSKYASYNNMRFGIKALDDFFFYMYYTTRCESIVRNAEVAAAMDAQGIEDDKFADYLSNTQTYKMLKEIQAWTFEGMVADMKANMAEIRKVVGQSAGRFTEVKTKNGFLVTIEGDLVEGAVARFGEDFAPAGKHELEDGTKITVDEEGKIVAISDDAFIEKLLTMAIHRMNTESIETLVDRVKVPMFFGVPMIDPDEDATDEEKSEFVNAFIDLARKDVADPVRYYKNKEKYFHETAGRLIKKLGKLFSLAKPSSSNPLHAKISAKTRKNESRITRWNDFGH